MSNSRKAIVRNLPITLIEPNPDNPRIIFDQEKMDDLIVSIKDRDILVPLSVFQSAKKFRIIDGERGYRASLQLGLKELPVIINSRPKDAEYVKDMFHIHHMREPWELVPTAIELEKVSKLLAEENKGKKPSEKELSKTTGLTVSEVRRCRTVLSFPTEIQDIMLKEEAKTKREKSEIGKDKILTEDFFIEIAKNIVKPLEDNNDAAFRQAGGKKKIYFSLVEKRRKGLIKNIVSLRPIPKYIRDHPVKAGKEIKKFIQDQQYSSDDLVNNVNLDFDLYKFQRNVNVFIGAIENIPDSLKEEQKVEILKILRQTEKEIKGKIKRLG